MSDTDSAGSPWTDSEIDLIVADYFDMLNLEILGSPYVKSQRNQALRRLTGRSKGSIEYKHQNISAVLLRLGLPWILGYKPMANFQNSLIDGIDRYISQRDQLSFELPITTNTGLSQGPSLFLEEPPSVSTEASDELDSDSVSRLVRKFDPAKRDARNRYLGKQGEELVLGVERERLRSAGRPDLANQVRWVSEVDGDGAGFDILSFNPSGGERLIEVKTTNGYQKTPFYVTENERLVSMERPDEFRLVRVYDFCKAPRAFELCPPLERFVKLTPTTYRAQFSR